MSKSKNSKGHGKKELSLVRSSAAEYLTFVAAGGGSEASVEMRYEDENIWLTQKMMATLYDVSVPAINQHLKRIFADNELTRGTIGDRPRFSGRGEVYFTLTLVVVLTVREAARGQLRA